MNTTKKVINKKAALKKAGIGFIASALTTSTLLTTMMVPTFAAENTKETGDVIASCVEGMLKKSGSFVAKKAVGAIPVVGELLSESIEPLVELLIGGEEATEDSNAALEEMILKNSDAIIDKISELKSDVKTSKDEILTAMKYNTKKLWDRIEASDLKRELMSINDSLCATTNLSVYKNAIMAIDEISKPGFRERYEAASAKAAQSAAFKSFIAELKSKYNDVNEEDYSELTKIIKENKREVDFKNYIDTRLACFYSNVDDLHQSQGASFMENFEALSQKMIGMDANGETKYANVFDIYSASIATKYLFNKDTFQDRRDFITSVTNLYTKQYMVLKTAVLADIARNTEMLEDDDCNSYIVESNIERANEDLAKIEKYYQAFLKVGVAEKDEIKEEEDSKYVICYKTGKKYAIEFVNAYDIALPVAGTNMHTGVQEVVEKYTEKTTIIPPAKAYYDGCENSPNAEDFRAHEVRTHSNYNDLMKNTKENRGKLDEIMKDIMNRTNGVSTKNCNSVLKRAEDASAIQLIKDEYKGNLNKKLRMLFPKEFDRSYPVYTEGSYKVEKVDGQGIKISRDDKYLYDSEVRTHHEERVISFGNQNANVDARGYNDTYAVLCVVE